MKTLVTCTPEFSNLIREALLAVLVITQPNKEGSFNTNSNRCLVHKWIVKTVQQQQYASHKLHFALGVQSSSKCVVK